MVANPNMKVVLLAEDDPDDIYLITEAFAECNLGVKLCVVQDGEELLDYLYQRQKYAADEPALRPDLILLDLNMPLMDGRDALVEIKKDAVLRTIPVVILTTSAAEEDLDQAYKTGASGYISKPVSFHELREIVNKLGAYWLGTVTLPDH
jgi:two-component system, response regulator